LNTSCQALVIGGGFYGAKIAAYLALQRGLSQVVLLERAGQLLTRASANNQARVHNGYHYPRSFTTAFRSRVNLPRFVADYPEAVVRDFTKLYAVARRNSNVTASQFERFCQQIDATLHPAPAALRNLFDPRLIEEVYVAEEYAFDYTWLRKRVEAELDQARVKCRFNCTVRSINSTERGLVATFEAESGALESLEASVVFNCTYSGLNQFGGQFPGTKLKLKHEITEMALMQVPPALLKLGVTVMDGAYFSMMPYPSRGLHTLSHVRYTPHEHWLDQPGVDPYDRLRLPERQTRVDRMVRDVARYMPAIRNATYCDSLFEVKTVLVKNEGDDGRPILFERHPELPGCYSILGGKLDNIYDVMEKLAAERMPSADGVF
jgi:glycine/D-amino acid oxidase-like deaminating enzyme